MCKKVYLPSPVSDDSIYQKGSAQGVQHMPFVKKIGQILKNMSPTAIREVIAVTVLLCLSVFLSMPQYFADKREAENRKNNRRAGIYTDQEAFTGLGMDPMLVDKASDMLANTSAISFLVLRNGKLLHERYYSDEGATNTYSVTKSILSALIGIAIREGYIRSVEDTVSSYLPDHFAGVSDKRWEQITIRHLLTMTPGFCENLDEWVATQDWIKATLELPLEYEPGSKFQYANSSSHLLSMLLTEAAGMSVKEFADMYLFGSLEIEDVVWAADPSGYQTGFANLYLKPSDLAKVGWLYCNSGKWGDTQVIPAEWILQSTKVQVPVIQEPVIPSDEQKSFSSDMNSNTYGNRNPEPEDGYGYQWWVSSLAGHHAYSAIGFGGQSITVLPDLGLVVVITSVPGYYSISDEDRNRLFTDYIIPAIASNINKAITNKTEVQ